jgi:hypothetical protein
MSWKADWLFESGQNPDKTEPCATKQQQQQEKKEIKLIFPFEWHAWRIECCSTCYATLAQTCTLR